jgi:gamma-glutamyltranspeptidase/glutathione hydrolase
MSTVQTDSSKLPGLFAFAAASVLAIAACAPSGASTATSIAAPANITDPMLQTASSSRGMVASASKLATAVGATVLAQGGNAVDAAAATSFALAVTEPSMSGLGGRVSIVIRVANGEVVGVDGLNQVPRGFRDSTGAPAGYTMSAIPGVPSAIVSIVRRYGTWPLSRIIAPAIALAENGYPLGPLEASRMAEAAAELRRYSGSRRYFLKPDGTPYAEGELFVQRDLARTLRAIADGGDSAFYRGWIADSIHADMMRNGGFITREALAGYQAIPAIIVRGRYRGYDLVSNYEPASGHVVIEALQIMERFNLSERSTAEYASIVGQAMQLALADRSRRFGTLEESARRLTSPEHAAERAREVGDPSPPAPRPGDDDETWWLRPDQDNTTHVSVVDENRMAVALTQSLGPSLGSRVSSPGTGFLFATRLGNVPGSRPGSTIAPTIITDSAGRTRYVLGAAGDARIISAVIQTVSRMFDQRLPLEQAIASPRLHPMGRGSIRVERGGRIGWSDADIVRLRQLGFQLDTAPSSFFARVHAVAVNQDALRLIGVAEPRGLGSAAGPRP